MLEINILDIHNIFQFYIVKIIAILSLIFNISPSPISKQNLFEFFWDLELHTVFLKEMAGNDQMELWFKAMPPIQFWERLLSYRVICSELASLVL